MDKKKIIPEIRFNGFEEEWEEKRLGEIAEIIMGQSPSSKNYTNNKLDKILIQGNQDIENGKVVPRIWTKQITKLAKKGDIIFTVRAPVGDVAITNYDAVIGRGVSSIKSDKFLFYYLQKKKIFGYWNKFVEGSTFESINSDVLKKADFNIPIESERKNISCIFEKIDKIIEYLDKTVLNLQTYKQSMLKKMLPKQGEKVPEVRFEGFEGEWEEKRINNIGEIKTGKTPITTDHRNFSEDGIMFITPTDINNLITENTKTKLSEIGVRKSTLVPAGSILITCIASIGKNSLILEDSTFNQQINSITPTKEYNSYFILTSSLNWSEKMKHMAASGTMQIINKTEFSKMKSLVPSLEEQQIIGTFFQSLDNQISLQQQKLDTYKKLKKTLLEKMFI
ncbi:restriction endonuclease subunit S [Helcococcus kunzii]